MTSELSTEEQSQVETAASLGKLLFVEPLSERATTRQYYLLALALITILTKFALVVPTTVGAGPVTGTVQYPMAFQAVLGIGCAFAAASYATLVLHEWTLFRYRQSDANKILWATHAAAVEAVATLRKLDAQRVAEVGADAGRVGGEMKRIRDRYNRLREANIRSVHAAIEKKQSAQAKLDAEEESVIEALEAKFAQLANRPFEYTMSDEEKAQRLKSNNALSLGDEVVRQLVRNRRLHLARIFLEIWVPLLMGTAGAALSIPAVGRPNFLSDHTPVSGSTVRQMATK